MIHSTPVVADGCVYTGTDLGNVYALNADTGKVVWSQALGDGGEGSGTFEGAGIVGSPAVADGLVYVGATTPKASVLSALDQATGKVVWRRVVDDDEGGGLDSSPVPFKGMVFQAFKGDEASDHSQPRLRDRRRVTQEGAARSWSRPTPFRRRTSRPAIAAARSSTRPPST